MKAAGQYMSPIFVFPGKNHKSRLMNHAPPGSHAMYHESGWIQKDSFIVWFGKFVEFSNPLPQKLVLFLLDRHASYPKIYELINIAQERNVILLYCPSHCAHRLQSLDLTFMTPLSIYYKQEIQKWLIHHPGRHVTIYEIAELFGAAFLKVAQIQTAIEGFRKIGILPINIFLFILIYYSLTIRRNSHYKEAI
ncbi:uncharacterized protein LOC143151720 [Ptiloglossa arizonensis]|uniref:uncharacterized protein LOC143151720 n=1 Tax=Ptiloglossa arizonensis TaxID=3350558 RepID=UPI003F9FE1AF